MKKWYKYWTIWAAIASALACWMIMWITGDQEPGTGASTLATAAAAFLVAFFVQRSRAKKAAAAAQSQQVAQTAAQMQQAVPPAAQSQRAEATGAHTPSKPRAVFERHKLGGTSFRLDAIMDLAEDNPDYDMSKREIIDAGMEGERIYQYKFPVGPVELVDEPENEHDPNAIKVLVAGQHIGYIKRGSTGRIHNLQRSGRVLGVTAEIYGGKYKVVTCYDDDDGVEQYELIKDESLYGAAIEVLVKPEAAQEQEPVSTLDT